MMKIIKKYPIYFTDNNNDEILIKLTESHGDNLVFRNKSGNEFYFDKSELYNKLINTNPSNSIKKKFIYFQR